MNFHTEKCNGTNAGVIQILLIDGFLKEYVLLLSLQLGGVPVPWLPWIPVHPGKRQTPRGVQKLHGVQHSGSHQSGPVYSQNSALSPFLTFPQGNHVPIMV